MIEICGFDCDGVLSIPALGKSRIMPDVGDIIITGRSYEEEKETREYLNNNGIWNEIFFNPAKFEDKSRESSGHHKANILTLLKNRNINVKAFFEDDEIQARIIKRSCSWVNIIMVVHDLVEKNNVRRDGDGNEL